MEVRVGNYLFVISESVNVWNGTIINKTYKIGGNIADCANVSVNFINNIAVSANIPYIMYDEECSIDNTLDKGTGSMIMITHLHL